jgi:hypothetical protein
MPSFHDFSKVGDIMNIVINNAREMRTILGGVLLVDKAERVSENTTISLVNDVIIMTMDGASDKTVIRANTLKIRAEAVPVAASCKFRLRFWAWLRVGISKNTTTNPKRLL